MSERSTLNLCVLSGKGGTGKTTVATNLSLVMGYNYIDCDVEEPNGYIFLKPQNIKCQDVTVDLPVIDEKRCTLCRKCSEICAFNALVSTQVGVMVFEKLCHACGACSLVCEAGAVSFSKRRIGVIEKGDRDGHVAARGVLDIGELMAVPVIKKLLKELPDANNILDCSPGTSCNVVNTIEYADKAILVTEPSLFGMHDLEMAVTLLRAQNIPFGVVVNKHIHGSTMAEDFCSQHQIKIIGRISHSREAAEAYSAGLMLTELPEYKKEFEAIASRLEEVRFWNLP